MALAVAGTIKADGTWQGLTVSPEHRCAPYERDDYPYSQSVETRIMASMGGGVYGPYTGRSSAEIEHWSMTSRHPPASAPHERTSTAGTAELLPGYNRGVRRSP